MYNLVFLLHLFVFLSLLFVTKVRKNYLHPAVFWLLFNYFYFFILWYIGWKWVIQDQDYLTECFIGYYYAVFFGVGLLFSILIQEIFGPVVDVGVSLLFKILNFRFRFWQLIWIYLSFSLLFIYINYSLLGTFNPIKALAIKHLIASHGKIIRTKFAYISPILHNLIYFSFLLLLYIILLYTKIIKYILLPFLMLFTMYIFSFTASKSSILFVLVYSMFVYHNFIRRINLFFLLSSSVFFSYFGPYFKIITIRPIIE